MAQDPTLEHARRTRRFDALVALILALVFAGLLTKGWSFYVLGLDARLDHEAYEQLRPSGLVGHGYGIVGTVLILSNLLYLARRRVARSNLGSMRLWLDLHVFAGLAGSVLVLFHSAFQFRTGIALLTGASLGLVVFTGLVGRYLYALSPLADIPKLDRLLTELDQQRPGLERALRAALDAHRPTAVDHHASLLTKLLHAPGWLRVARARQQAMREALDEARDCSAVVAFGGTLLDIAAQDVLADGFATLLQSWRAFHRLLAVLLVLLVPIHVGVAWMYGYRWIFD